jgi:hypothetical protein
MTSDFHPGGLTFGAEGTITGVASGLLPGVSRVDLIGAYSKRLGTRQWRVGDRGRLWLRAVSDTRPNETCSSKPGLPALAVVALRGCQGLESRCSSVPDDAIEFVQGLREPGCHRAVD